MADLWESLLLFSRGLSWSSARDQANIAGDALSFQKHQYRDQRDDAKALAIKQEQKDARDAETQRTKDIASGEALAWSLRNSHRSARAADDSAKIAKQSLESRITASHVSPRARMAHVSTLLTNSLRQDSAWN